jgi:hypothetical protein
VVRVTSLIVDLLQMRKNFAQLAARITYRLDLVQSFSAR